METVDVAIVGAGPAGSTLATLLAKRGIAVALIDRDEFPRDKLCGEFLSYDALPILEQLGVVKQLDHKRAPRITTCRVVSRRATYEFDFPRAARGVSRILLDNLLNSAAVAAGAIDHTGWTATAIAPELTIERGEEKKTIAARVVVGAWGRWGRFDNQLGRAFVRDRSRRYFGFKRHYRPAKLNGVIELHSFDRGYLGISPVEHGVTNLCGLVHASRLHHHKGRWDAFVEGLNLHPAMDGLEPAQEEFLSSEPVIFRPRDAVENHVLMIGDASGIVDPLTGNGMAMAIQSALLAASCVRQLAAADANREQIETRYRAEHAAFFGKRIGWSRWLGHLLSRPRLLDAALRTGIHGQKYGRFFLRKTRARDDAVSRMIEGWFW